MATVGLAVLRQICSPGLLKRAHKFTHSGLHLTDGIVVTITVAVDHDKFVVLLLFKEVWHLERSREVWVKIVFDLFRLANFGPMAIDLLENNAHGV